MSNVLIVIETTPEGALRKASLPAVSFGRKVAEGGGSVHLLVLGSGVGGAAEEARAFAPKVTVVDDAKLKGVLAETYAPIIARVAKESGATVVAATATAFGKDTLPRVAALLDAGMASDVVGVAGPKSFKRPILAGNAIATIEVTTPIAVVSVRQTEFPAAEALASPGELVKAAAGDVDAKGAEFVRNEVTKSARPDLSEARVVVSGGRGMKEGKNFKILEELTDLMGGAMGASRAACDAGMVPNDLQVGQTGKVVAPDLYIAVAISGAIQHLAGMKGSKVIVAINKDGEAPIFQVADYGLVGTWEKEIPALIAEIKKLKAAQ